MKLIDKLKRYRDRNGLTQTQLSDKLGISIQFTSRCMAGKQKLPLRVVLDSRDIGAGITIADIMDYLTAKL
jgi:transcriptional regulator with XRE-family HTH domain